MTARDTAIKKLTSAVKSSGKVNEEILWIQDNIYALMGKAQEQARKRLNYLYKRERTLHNRIDRLSEEVTALTVEA